jgi:hypothetical protein
MLADSQRRMKADTRSIGTTSAELFSMMIEVVGVVANKDAELKLGLARLRVTYLWESLQHRLRGDSPQSYPQFYSMLGIQRRDVN